MLCAIWYHLYNLKNVKHVTLLKVTHLRGCFSRFLNCKYGTKSRKASHILFICQVLSDTCQAVSLIPWCCYLLNKLIALVIKRYGVPHKIFDSIYFRDVGL